MSDSYRVTFDASHKVKAGGGHVNGFLHHVARDLDDANGVAREHANRNIDRARTAHNVTVVPDGRGGWRRPASVDELTGRLDARLGTLKKAPRNGAVLMRPIVANLSPEWFTENDPDWRENGLSDESRAAYDALLQQAVEEFGADNIVVASLHMDETLPQWQIAVAMVTDDGRLTQKPWDPGPTALTTMGKRFRQAVADTGIAVNFTPAARSKEHLSGEEFGRRADMLREAQADVADTEAALDVQAESLETRRANVAAREAKAKEDAAQAARDAEEAAQARARAEEAERAAEAERARLAAVPTPEPVELSRAEVLAELPDVFSSYLRDFPKVAEHFDAYVDRKYDDKLRITKRAHPLGEYHGPGRDQFARQTKKDADAQRRRRAQDTTQAKGAVRSLIDGLG